MYEELISRSLMSHTQRDKQQQKQSGPHNILLERTFSREKPATVSSCCYVPVSQNGHFQERNQPLYLRVVTSLFHKTRTVLSFFPVTLVTDSHELTV